MKSDDPAATELSHVDRTTPDPSPARRAAAADQDLRAAANGPFHSPYASKSAGVGTIDAPPRLEPRHSQSDPGWVIETIFSPFHCLYQDALYFHTQSRLALSEGEASRVSRAALLLYLSSAESLVHHAAEELGRPELRGLIADPRRPLPLNEVWRLLPAIAAEPGDPIRPLDPDAPPWPQFAELLSIKNAWAYPGPAANRRAYYHSRRRDGDYEPLQPHRMPSEIRSLTSRDTLTLPRTGLPRDPYALRPHHLDTARGVLDAAIEALDRRMNGSLTKDQRHRREPVRLLEPPQNS